MDSLMNERSDMGFGSEESRYSCPTFDGEESIKSGEIPQNNKENIPNSRLSVQAEYDYELSKNSINLPLCLRSPYTTSKRPHAIEETIRRIHEQVYFHELIKTEGAKSFKFRWEPYPIENIEERHDRQKDMYKDLSAHELRSKIYEREGLKGLFCHDRRKKNGGNARRRSEGVESIVNLTLTTLLHYCDLRTMAIGLRGPGRGANSTFVDYAFIVKESGQTLSRVRKSIRELKKQGFVTTKKLVKKVDGRYVTIGIEIYLTDKIFNAVLLEKELEHDRIYAGAVIQRKLDIKPNGEKYISPQIRSSLSHLNKKFTINPNSIENHKRTENNKRPFNVNTHTTSTVKFIEDMPKEPLHETAGVLTDVAKEHIEKIRNILRPKTKPPD